MFSFDQFWLVSIWPTQFLGAGAAKRLLVIAVIASARVLSSSAETMRLDGEAYHPNLPIDWVKSTTNCVPESIAAVYKVLPQKFSKEAISNMLVIASFSAKKGVTVSKDKKTMSWRHYDKRQTLRRSLDVASVYGYVRWSS